MKIVKDIGTTINYENVLNTARVVKNSYTLEETEEQVDSVSVVYQLYNFGWCDIISVYNYINEFIDDYNSFSDFEKEFCQTIGIFATATLTDQQKREYKQAIYKTFKKDRMQRWNKCVDTLSYGQEQGDVEIGYAEFHEYGENYVIINSSGLLDYFNSVGFESNVLYTIENKSIIKEILEI